MVLCFELLSLDDHRCEQDRPLYLDWAAICCQELGLEALPLQEDKQLSKRPGYIVLVKGCGFTGFQFSFQNLPWPWAMGCAMPEFYTATEFSQNPLLL